MAGVRRSQGEADEVEAVDPTSADFASAVGAALRFAAPGFAAAAGDEPRPSQAAAVVPVQAIPRTMSAIRPACLLASAMFLPHLSAVGIADRTS